jgi:hypothetical protein
MTLFNENLFVQRAKIFTGTVVGTFFIFTKCAFHALGLKILGPHPHCAYTPEYAA